jgi:hypothetical protein
VAQSDPAAKSTSNGIAPTWTPRVRPETRSLRTISAFRSRVTHTPDWLKAMWHAELPTAIVRTTRPPGVIWSSFFDP